ncbi:velvet factor [Mycena alexandri]|uniref:Velvet factor n=1 Tax=Mycena alexandri TaxID=1745969 RepID=A0AAD6SMQ9_9AGAR|nr:velvet factor [Mycena alexandri]
MTLPPPWTLRFLLTEIQSPEMGRKCGIVDRRPLDPPAVVQLQAFIVTDPGTAIEHTMEIQDYEWAPLEILRRKDLNSAGYLCETELFMLDDAGNSFGASATNYVNSTHDLIGSKVVESAIIKYHGRQCLVFPFTDLSSKATGNFFLGYKFFDVLQLGGQAVGSVQAQCWGNSFRVYSSKDTPPMNPSTALTKSLADAGLRVHQRSQRRERGKRKRPSDDDSAASQS